jgi:hypothetical protein
MLLSVSPMISVCLERAREAREKIAASRFEQDRAFWAEMERRWLALSYSYELSERLDTFMTNLEGGSPGSRSTAARLPGMHLRCGNPRRRRPSRGH